MLARFRQAFDAGRKAVEDAAPLRQDPANAPPLALLVLEEVGPAADDLRRRHLSAAREAGTRALLILGPGSMHEHADPGLLCEYLPLPEDLVRTTGDRPGAVTLYIRNRFRLILDKWGVRECCWLGEDAADLVDAWTGSDDPTLRPVRFRPAF